LDDRPRDHQTNGRRRTKSSDGLLFAVSHDAKAKPNDADRLRTYLA
jgi:sigma54-dependent transcription regulator